MKRENGIKWLFMDLNSYFASVEQQENPMLRGKPVAVVPMETEHTCAIAASYEAKLYGIKTGTIIRDAKNMCPVLQCVLAHHDKYVAYHNLILSEVIKHTPIHTVWSIDELSSRLPPGKRNVESARHLAKKIKQGIWDNVGEVINCSIGFAPNSLLAKIACEMNKPDGLTILRQEDLPGPLLQLQLTDLPGIGKNMERRLHRSGVYSIQDFWNTSPKQARKIWGSVQGERFWYLLHGHEVPNLQQKTSMIGHSRVLDTDMRTPEKARLMMRKLTQKAATRLRSKGYLCRTISLSCRTKSGIRCQRQVTVNPTQNPFYLAQHIDHLWCNIIHEAEILHKKSSPVATPLSIKKISVILHNLIEPQMVTENLFLKNSSPAKDTHEKQESLTLAMEKLRNKYQKDIVSVGVPPKAIAGYVGTKIAFSRVPDVKEFWS